MRLPCATPRAGSCSTAVSCSTSAASRTSRRNCSASVISYANRRWHDLGYEQRQLLGQPLEDLVAPARRQIVSEAFSATLAGRQVDNLDLQILRGDGRVGQFSVNLSPMRDEQ